MYFDAAAMIISEVGGHGDTKLKGVAYDRDDRRVRIEGAAARLFDFVYEDLRDHGEFGPDKLFQQKHLARIKQMIAVAMMAQFEHDQEMEGELVRAILEDAEEKAA